MVHLQILCTSRLYQEVALGYKLKLFVIYSKHTTVHQFFLQIWSFYLHPLQIYERWFKMSWIGWWGVYMGHSKSLEIAPFDRALSAYEFVLAFHSKYVPILNRFWHIARCSSKIADFNLPHVCLMPPWGWCLPLELAIVNVTRPFYCATLC